MMIKKTDNAAKSGQQNETKARIAAEMEHKYRFEPGSRIANRFVVKDHLGVGGFAEVYLCRDENLHVDRAVKVLIEEKGNLQEEARVSAKLNHPNVIRVYDFDVLEDDTPIIIFEYIAGNTLEDRLEQTEYRRLTLDQETFHIIQQVGEALGFAHKQGVVHRDIKPSNIIITESNHAYLTDFGLAGIKKAPEGKSMLSADMRSGMSGTVPYMAPERILEKVQGDEQSDIYSLGVVVYEILTGRLPFQGRDTRLIFNIANDDVLPIPPTVSNPELPPGLDDVLLKALQYEPQQRYGTVGGFLQALADVTANFAKANTDYQQAIDHIENSEWRSAQAILNKLPTNFKDVELRRDQVQREVRLLELYDRAAGQVSHQNFKAALDTLDSIKQVDPDYDVETLRQQALEGQAQIEKQTLEQQYIEAVTLFEKGDFQAALDTLDIIAKKSKDYPDAQGIRVKAEEKVNHQKELRTLYNEGVTQSRNEKWGNALVAFEALSEKEPGYEDVGDRLVIARHLSELFDLRREASQKQAELEYAAAIDLLNEIKHRNSNYKPAEIEAQRQQALEGLFEKCRALQKEQSYATCLLHLQELKEREPKFSGLAELEEDAREGLSRQERLAELATLYEQAEAKLENRQYEETLVLWRRLEQQKGDLGFADTRQIVREAKEGIYGEAAAAVAAQQPDRALSLWQTLKDFDDAYEDRNDVVAKAKKQIKRAQLQRRLIFGGGGLVVLLLLIYWGGRAAFGGGATTPTPTLDAGATETAVALFNATSTATPSPTTTPTTAVTATGTPTDTPSPTETTVPTLTPTSTRELKTIAIAQLSSSIFSQPDENATELTFVGVGEEVEVLETRDSWIRVIDSDGVEGWAAANRFEIVNAAPTETPTPTKIFTPTNTPGAVTARTDASATLFAGPGTNYGEITFVEANTLLSVVGRSGNSSWLFVRTSNEVEGWVAVSLVTFNGNVNDLPVSEDLVTVTPQSGGSGPSDGGELQGLTFDFWHLPGENSCSGGGWVQAIYMEGHGGDGRYTYFIDGVQVAGPGSGSFVYQLSGSGTATARITGVVRSGDGQTREIILFVPAPDCS